MLRTVAVVVLVAVALVAVRAQEGEEHEDEFHPFEYYSYDGAFNNPASIAASAGFTSRADLLKYRWAAASKPCAPAPRYARLR